MSYETQQIFSDISTTYDKLNHILSLNSDKRWRKKTVLAIKADPRKHLVALDLCAGTLDLSLNFLHRFPLSTVYALDFAYSMLEEGCRKITPRLANQIQLICGDAISLPLKSQSIDIIFCGYGFRNLDDQERGLDEIYRVLRPGGQILILDFFRPTNLATRLFHQTYGRFILPLVGGWISGNRQAYRYLEQSIGQFYTLSECKKIIENHGFNRLEEKDFLKGISSLITGFKESHI